MGAFVVRLIELRRAEAEVSGQVYDPADTTQEVRNYFHRFPRREGNEGNVHAAEFVRNELIIRKVALSGERGVQRIDALTG
jgi:hypothetical protein